MPSNAGTIGVDYSFGYYDASTKSLVDLGDIQSVDIKAQKHDLKNMPYNASPKYDYIPDGYRVTFQITRTNAQLEQIAAQRELKFNAGQTIPAGYLQKTVTNVDGSTSIFQYTGFVIFLGDHGAVSREKLVTLNVEGMASRMVQLA